ncbi:MAG: cytochrome c nitrite reductase small subunit [Deltaproteobacteria bacterium]|nr:cytochrome c nitrite reductase small subunit [Deltaproteobacteria bacterium]
MAFRWIIMLVGIPIGAALGLGIFTFIYAEGGSYLTNNPQACANCHVMQGHYDAWIKSSHRSVAVCNDCHTPAGFIGKYTVKAVNGFWHSFAFTSGKFPEPIRIKQRNRKVTEKTCLKCHKDIVSDISNLPCLPCHSTVGHSL